MSAGARTRSRTRAFVLVVVACVAVGGAATVAAIRGSGEPAPRPADPVSLAAVTAAAAAPSGAGAAAGSAAGFMLVRDLERNRAGAYGEVVAVRLDDPAGTRTPIGLRCDRIAFQAGVGLCTQDERSIPPGFRLLILGPDFKVLHTLELAGFSSRARISPDGRYGATTGFVNGHSYAQPGQFSTQASIIDIASGKAIADLEKFTVTRDGKKVTAQDVNFWGISFTPQDSDVFYATLSTGGANYLIRGRVSTRKAETIRAGVECPSVSPDGTRIAFKHRDDAAGAWRLHVLTIATGADVALSETRNVDDQAEWLDDDHVLYKIDEETWEARADGTGQPTRLLQGADSPAVARAAVAPHAS